MSEPALELDDDLVARLEAVARGAGIRNGKLELSFSNDGSLGDCRAELKFGPAQLRRYEVAGAAREDEPRPGSGGPRLGGS